MHPYRPLHCESGDDEPPRDHDDRVLGALLLGLGLVRVIPALALGEGFGSEVTIACVMAVLGAAMALDLRRLFRSRSR
jgi:hypothetical protein